MALGIYFPNKTYLFSFHINFSSDEAKKDSIINLKNKMKNSDTLFDKLLKIGTVIILIVILLI